MNVSRSDESADPPEVYEHISWAELASASPEKKPWVIYLAAGVIAVGSLGALAARSIDRTAVSPPPSFAPTSTVPVVNPLPPAAHEEEILTEADLLAVAPGQGEVGAAARAEWFVTDYFSSGGDPAASRAVLDALPESSHLPAAARPGSTSYVEWAATARIESIGNEQFRSTVIFRVLVPGDDGSYVRLPVQAVNVIVEVDAGGGTRVIDLPMPVGVPTGPPVPTWAAPSEDVPDLIRTAALRMAESWGTDPTLIEGNEREGGWRVVVSVADGAGVRWPLSLWLTDQGDPA
jgi:hypothetical protein